MDLIIKLRKMLNEGNVRLRWSTRGQWTWRENFKSSNMKWELLLYMVIISYSYYS